MADGYKYLYNHPMSTASPRIHAPELAPGAWLNTPHPLRLADLRGGAVFIDIWDFT